VEGFPARAVQPVGVEADPSAVRHHYQHVAGHVQLFAPGLQEIGTLVAAATCWGLFFDEINKFFWWPLHLSGYLLVVVPIPLFIGLHHCGPTGLSSAPVQHGCPPSSPDSSFSS
jgi:hypothetical protein